MTGDAFVPWHYYVAVLHNKIVDEIGEERFQRIAVEAREACQARFQSERKEPKQSVHDEVRELEGALRRGKGGLQS